MKIKLLLLSLVVSTMSTANAEDTFSPITTTSGKVWTLSFEASFMPGYYEYQEYKLEGELVVDGMSYKCLWVRNCGEDGSPQTEWRSCGQYVGEKDGKVYCYDQSSGVCEPLLDFSAKPGDRIPYMLPPLDSGEQDAFEIIAVSDTILPNSDDRQLRKCVYVSFLDGHEHDVWVEGIGSLTYGISFYNTYRATGGFPLLKDCRDGSAIIYQANTWTSQYRSPWQSAAPHSLFDLQGRRLSAPPARGLYIEGGRKLRIGRFAKY